MARGRSELAQTFIKWVSGTALLIAGFNAAAAGLEPSGHPRLWITADDVPALRQRAVAGNTFFAQGLGDLAQNAAAQMDVGDIPDNDAGNSTYSAVNTEAYAAVFAFMANVDPDPVRRGDWAQRGRTLLMYIMDRVDTCLQATPALISGPYCSLSFSVSDRSRWQGASFPLAADWLQSATLPNGSPALSAADKATIRRVFIYWSRLNMEAYPNPYSNPTTDSLPVGTTGDALLRSNDPRHYRLRFSLNNYFVSHTRQLAMMALALDKADDHVDPLAPATYPRLNSYGNVVYDTPFGDGDGVLTGFIEHALRGWLLMTAYALENDAQGGIPAEGSEYASSELGAIAQTMLALTTAGYAGLEAKSVYGDPVMLFTDGRFLRSVLPATFAALPPQPVNNPDFGWIYQPAWVGDGEVYLQPDHIGVFGPIALISQYRGDTATVDAIRWLQRHVPPEGSDDLLSRMSNSEDPLESILYFLLFDPAAPGSAAAAPDPRPNLPTAHWSPGLGRLLSRTGWDANASLFVSTTKWNSIDHQQGDGMGFEWYHGGEWLTHMTIGYGIYGGASDYKNTLTVRNTLDPNLGATSSLRILLSRGAQAPQGRSQTDPVVVARSETDQLSYITSEATGLYNVYYSANDGTSAANRADDVSHVSRSILWLKGDRIVVYDRVATAQAAQPKDFWLNLPDRLPAFPTINNRTVTSTTPGGQHLFVTSLLPQAAALSIVTSDPTISYDAGNLYAFGSQDPLLQNRAVPGHPNATERYATRLRISATGNPQTVNFLTLLDAGTSIQLPPPAETITAITAGGLCPEGGAAYDGMASGSDAVLFSRSLTLPACLEYNAPVSVSRHVVTGLQPFGGYSITTTAANPGYRNTRIQPGGSSLADAGGVLVFDPGQPPPAPAAAAVLDVSIVNFGAVETGQPYVRSVELSSTGTLPIQIDAIEIVPQTGGNVFSLQDTCPRTPNPLASGQSCTAEIHLETGTVGYASATLNIESNSSVALSALPLRADAEEPPLRIFKDSFEDL